MIRLYHGLSDEWHPLLAVLGVRGRKTIYRILGDKRQPFDIVQAPADLLKLTRDDFMEMKNCGPVTVEEIMAALGYVFGDKDNLLPGAFVAYVSYYG